MSTLPSKIFHVADQQPHAPALIAGEVTVSYGQFADAVLRLAGALSQLGVKKGDRAALMLPNVPHFCVSYYAILHLGAVVVPLNFMNDVNDLRRQLTDSGATVLITWQGFHKQAQAAVHQSPTSTLIYLGEKIPVQSYSLTQIMAAATPQANGVEIDDDEPAVISYTSGISDQALGAVMSHRALAANAATVAEMFRMGAQDRVPAVLPLFHPLGQTMVLHATLASGGSVVLLPRFQPLEVIRTMQSRQATLLPAVPGMFRAFNELENDDLQLPSLKCCLCYGGLLPQETQEAFENRFGTVILKAYGLTEAGPLVSSSRIDRDRKENAVGLPLVGVEVQIRNEQGKILSPNQRGEVFVKSPSLMLGYYHRPEETARRLQDGWLATGDIGYLDIDHYLFIVERKDDIIHKGGFEIYPREVERVLLEFDGVDEAAVTSMPDPVHGAEVKAFVVLHRGGRPDARALMEHCRSQLPVYQCPKVIEFVDKLPKSATGRILKRLLRQSGNRTARP